MKRQVSQTKEEKIPRKKEGIKEKPKKRGTAQDTVVVRQRKQVKRMPELMKPLFEKKEEESTERVEIATKTPLFPSIRGTASEQLKFTTKRWGVKKPEIVKTSTLRVKSNEPRVGPTSPISTHVEPLYFCKSEVVFKDRFEKVSMKEMARVKKARVQFFPSGTQKMVKVEKILPRTKKITYDAGPPILKKVRIREVATGKKIFEDLEAEAEQSQKILEAVELNIFDLLFEESEDEKQNLKGILKIAPNRPVCIIAEKAGDENYISALQALCREIYRIKVGGLPRPKMISVSKREAEERVEAERSIAIIDDSDGRFFDYSKIRGLDVGEALEKVIRVDKLRERIMELPSQGFGFLIFYIKKEVAPVLLSKLAPLSHVIPKLFYVKLRDLSHEEKELISTVTWGLVKPPIIASRFDEFFKSCENAFYDRLERIANDLRYYRHVKESLEDEGEGGAESFLHYATKVLAVKHLVEKEKVSIEEIETEKKIDGVPDIFIETRGLAIEVETLYGTGTVPLRKLIKTIGKYRDPKYEFRIVLPNLQLLAFIHELRMLRKWFRDKGINFELYSLDVKKAELVPLEKFREKILRKSSLLFGQGLIPPRFRYLYKGEPVGQRTSAT